MKTFALTLAAGLIAATTAFAADPVEGIWQTAPDDNGNFGHIQVAPCGAAFCGTLVKAFDSAGKEVDSPNVGKQIVWDMMAQGDGSYEDGKVWSPDRDKTYNSYMTLSGDGLNVKGCILGICRDGGTWSRVK
ncbi:MAG: imidazoleglycerol-phosphate dehydratase [Rhodobacteraceae bacterium PARR1]|nr:MAG: imidazoleglycerol-phosphate dehydratase [Rhodobacteraceae bacterium PARR1]